MHMMVNLKANEVSVIPTFMVLTILREKYIYQYFPKFDF